MTVRTVETPQSPVKPAKISRVYSVRLDEDVDKALTKYQQELTAECLGELSRGDVLKYLAESSLVALGRLTADSKRDHSQSRLGGYTTISRLLALRKRELADAATTSSTSVRQRTTNRKG